MKRLNVASSCEARAGRMFPCEVTMLAGKTRADTNRVKVSGWDPRYRDDFVRLNKAWVTKYFAVEEADRKHFEDPEKTIVAPGGDIVFLVENERCVGVCALIACGDGVYELAKMAVLESEIGRGLGDILIEATIQRARELGARRIFLLSNTLLTAAISLYSKHGFKTVRLGSHPDYDRADIEMAIDLQLPPSF
ncbi:MAG: GNAT family N-acetyltransferase [bacterium]|nr:GNAT family N-acetyltransferase [bacterium]